MAATYWYAGSLWRDYLYLVDSDGAPITGDAANFELGVLGPNGDAGTTGVTITEPDAVNHPGVYEIEAAPTTSFVGTPGSYHISARNATRSQTFNAVLLVTAITQPTIYIDGGAFVASSGDGRVTDGTDPLEGALVTAVSSSGVVMYQSLTDADGLWAAVLPDDTYQISVNLSGYARVTASLTMTGGAGSFSTDLAMTATTTTTLTASVLFSYARRQTGDHIGAKANAQLEEAVNAALKVVSRDLSEHSWWETEGFLTLRASYTAGTVAVASGGTTVTLTSGTWPAWAASGEIYLDGTWYPVATRTDDTTLALANAYVGDALTASSYQLAQIAYAMPADLHDIGTTVFYDGTWPYGAEPTSYEVLLKAKNQRWQSYAEPMWVAHNNTFLVWPPPAADVLSRYLYRRAPAAVLYSAPTALVDIDPLLLDVLEPAIDVQLKRRGIFTGGEDPRLGYDAALRSARIVASQRPRTPAGMGRRGQALEPRLSRQRAL